MNVRNTQCAACPWRTSTRPARDIPGGYCETKHRGLASTIAEPGSFVRIDDLRMMACHEHAPGEERPCVGWLINQLGVGNNIGLRMMALDGRFKHVRADGPQHMRFEETLPKRRRARVRP